MRTVAFAIGVAWTLSAGQVAAQMTFQDMGVFDTRFGQLQVVGGAVDNFIWFNGETYNELYGARVSILAAIGRADQTHDWVLIRRETGGGGCFPAFTVLQVSNDGIVASPEFGHCDAEPLDMRINEAMVEVVLSHPDASIAEEVYGFDGVALMSGDTVVPLPTALPGAGPDVTRWIGQPPHAIFDDLGERARFATVVPENDINALANHVLEAGPTYQSGDWVIGQGCLPQFCGASHGIWGIRITDGAVGAAILGGNNYVAWFGLAETDPVLRAAAEAHRP